MTIAEYTKKQINFLIESWGISDEVVEARERLENAITSNPKSGRIEFEFCGEIIKVYPVPVESNVESAAYWIEPMKMLRVEIPVIKGKLRVDAASDSLQHELEHAYQNIKMGHGFGSQGLYNIASCYKNSRNEAERSVSHIIYASTRSEQDAMINGLYAELESKKGEDLPDNIIKQSHAYTWLGNLYKAYSYTKSHPEETSDAMKPYRKENPNFNLNKIMRIARKGIKEFEWKMARLVNNYKKKFLTENNVRIEFPSRPKLYNHYVEFLD